MSVPLNPSPSVLLCARDVRHGGGVAALASQLVAASNGQLDLQHIGRAYPNGWSLGVFGDPKRLRAHLRASPSLGCVVLNPSARSRAIVRDAALARVVLSEGRRLVVWWHGRSASLVSKTHLGWARILRWGFGSASGHLVLTDEMAAWVSSWSPDAQVARVMTAWDPLLTGGRIAALTDESPWLYLGRLHADKGLWDAIDTLKYEPKRRLLIAGDGPEAWRLEKRIDSGADGGRLRWIGHVTGEEKAQAILGAKGLLLPSYGEGAPLVVLEAMGAGLPVVGYDVGAVSEMVERAGHVVATGDRGALQAAMSSVESDLEGRRLQGTIGRERAARWTARAAVDRLMEAVRANADA